MKSGVGKKCREDKAIMKPAVAPCGITCCVTHLNVQNFFELQAAVTVSLHYCTYVA